MAAITVTAADVRPLPGASIERYQAGGTVNVGDLVILNSSFKVVQADADAAATTQPAIGIVVAAPNGATSAATDEWVDVCVEGRVTGFASLAYGSVFASVTAGAMDQTRPAGSSGDFLWVVGWAVSATTIRVHGYTELIAAL